MAFDVQVDESSAGNVQGLLKETTLLNEIQLAMPAVTQASTAPSSSTGSSSGGSNVGLIAGVVAGVVLVAVLVAVAIRQTRVTPSQEHVILDENHVELSRLEIA